MLQGQKNYGAVKNKRVTQILSAAGVIKPRTELLFLRTGGFTATMPEPLFGHRLTVVGPTSGSSTTLSGNFFGSATTHTVNSLAAKEYVSDGETWFLVAEWAD